MAIVALAAVAMVVASRPRSASSQGVPVPGFDPLAAVLQERPRWNLEAPVPSMCYTKTDGLSNPCWTCHTDSSAPNAMEDWDLQEEYAFSDFALTNRWQNLFEDRRAEAAAISDAEVLRYIREDNYTGLGASLAKYPLYPGYVPDLDLHRGFDREGFARDGSDWRAVRYKPFLGTFWPTNGSTDDVFIRLPRSYRVDGAGKPSRAVYKANLAILEAALCVPPAVADAAIDREVEPIDERPAGVDLDGDGRLSERATRVRGLPAKYAGGAARFPVMRHLYPPGVELLHTVRYVDPDSPSLLSRRLKELRYMRKEAFYQPREIAIVYAYEHREKELGRLPDYDGSPIRGLVNDFGWRIQGFIEDSRGLLRIQTREESFFCMGCHSSIGVTVDSTFGLPRKVPGAAGWGHQYLAGMPDVPQAGHEEPEVLTYFRRVGAGDEFRANGEILDRFFPEGRLDEAAVRRAAPGGDKDLAWLLKPSRERALALDKAYMALVRAQRFAFGRDTLLGPPANVHRAIENGDTALKATGRVFKDGALWLAW